MFLLPWLASGQWLHAAAGGKIARVTRENCARAAAAALESEFDGSRILEITGPDLLDQEEMAAILSRLHGKTISAIPTNEAGLGKAYVSAGIPEFFAMLLATFDNA